jgi:hypothetical protein
MDVQALRMRRIVMTVRKAGACGNAPNQALHLTGGA